MNIIKETEVAYVTERISRSWIDIARQGLTFEEFNQLFESAPFKLADWAFMLGISVRSLQRYQKSGSRFGMSESEKLLMLGHLFNRGREVFGDSDRFFLWLEKPAPSLNGRHPKELLDSMFGIQLIIDQLGRIEHGIVA